MPFANFHSARLSDPGKFDDFRYTHGGNLYGGKLKVPADIDVVWGHAKGGPENAFAPQALRFPKEKWDEKNAKKWLEENSIKTLEWAPAKEGEEKAEKRSLLDRRVLGGRGSLVTFGLSEQFVSLQAELQKAVRDVYGANCFVVDFSDTQVVFRPDNGGSSQTEGPVEVSNKLKMDSYQIVDGVIELEGDAIAVEQRPTYEPVSESMFVKLTMLENKLREGGPGSGNFGHAGRPGERGGSGEGGGNQQDREGSDYNQDRKGGASSRVGRTDSGVGAKEFASTYRGHSHEPNYSQIAVQPADKAHPKGGWLVADGGGEPYNYFHNSQSLDQFARGGGWKSGDDLVKSLGISKSDVIGKWTIILHDRVFTPEEGTKWGSKSNAQEYVESCTLATKIARVRAVVEGGKR